MLAWDLLWNFVVNAFISMLMLAGMRHYFLQSCVNMVFRHDWRPPSFSLISWAIMFHWLVYKLSNAPYFPCTIKNCWSLDKHGVLPWLINLHGNRKFDNHFVSMDLRIWCKHCFVFIPSYHLHARLHSRTPIRIFARLTMPQVKILGMSWFSSIGWVFPTVTLGYFVHYSYFAGMVNHSHEFVIKAEIKIINTTKIPKGALLFSLRLSTCSEMYKRRKLDIQVLH
jgi:hypothetical protein